MGPRQRAKRSAPGTARGSAGYHKKTAEEHAENEAAKENAAKQCKAKQNDPKFADSHQGKTFEDFYGTTVNLENAYGKCVSSKAKALKDDMDAKDEEKAEELKNAAKKCAAERGEMGTGLRRRIRQSAKRLRQMRIQESSGVKRLTRLPPMGRALTDALPQTAKSSLPGALCR